MRSWGSTPVPDTPAPGTPAEEGKKKKRKGDKGGTGSKANSNPHKNDEPASKKRKRDGSAEPEATPASAAAPSDKALKRIRKHMGKLEKGETMSLSQWIDKVSQGKEKSVDRADVLAGLQVAFVDGKWQLSA
jgi:cell growth-regulating nucleolar protein